MTWLRIAWGHPVLEAMDSGACGAPSEPIERPTLRPPPGSCQLSARLRRGRAWPAMVGRRARLEGPCGVLLRQRSLRLVVEWTGLHRHELLQNWALARAGRPLAPIEPLE